MSKAFTKDTDGEDDDLDEIAVAADVKNYMTPHGFATLQEELRQLMRVERPMVTALKMVTIFMAKDACAKSIAVHVI